jgi:predicted dehydrogenase
VIRLGILGTARIARAFPGYPLDGLEITAVASRTQERAQAFARETGIARWHGSYEDLLADPALDAVYIALPPRLNGEYAAKALECGKHVLVEKPAVVSTEQALKIEQALRGTGLIFMEGFMYRFMTVHRRAREIIAAGTIGRLRYIDFNFCFDIVSRGRTGYRTNSEFGGGALYDLGIYGVDFIRYITGEDLTLLQAHTHWDDEGGIDVFTHALWQGGETIAGLTCSFNADANYYVLSGDTGSITSPVAISGRQLPNILSIHLMEGDKKYEERFGPENPYKTEIEYFARCIHSNEQPFLGILNTRANIELLERILRETVPLRTTNSFFNNQKFS